MVKLISQLRNFGSCSRNCSLALPRSGRTGTEFELEQRHNNRKNCIAERLNPIEPQLALRNALQATHAFSTVLSQSR